MTFTGLNPTVERARVAELRSRARSLEEQVRNHHCPSNDDDNSHRNCASEQREMLACADRLRDAADRLQAKILRTEMAANVGWSLEFEQWAAIRDRLPAEYHYIAEAFAAGRFEVIGDNPIAMAQSSMINQLVLLDLLPDDQMGFVTMDNGNVAAILPGVADLGARMLTDLDTVRQTLTEGVPTFFNRGTDGSNYDEYVVAGFDYAGATNMTPIMMVGHSQGGMGVTDLANDQGFTSAHNLDLVFSMGISDAQFSRIPGEVHAVLVNNTNDMVVTVEQIAQGVVDLGHSLDTIFTGFGHMLVGDVDGGLARIEAGFSDAAEAVDLMDGGRQPGVTDHGNNNVEFDVVGGTDGLGHAMSNYQGMVVDGHFVDGDPNTPMGQFLQQVHRDGFATSGEIHNMSVSTSRPISPESFDGQSPMAAAIDEGATRGGAL